MGEVGAHGLSVCSLIEYTEEGLCDTPRGLKSRGFSESSPSNLPGVGRTTHGRRQPAVRYLLSPRRPFYPADGFPPEPVQRPGSHGASRLMGQPIRRLRERTREPEPRRQRIMR